MKVWELIAKLSKFPAGCEVCFSVDTQLEDGYVDIQFVGFDDDIIDDEDAPSLLAHLAAPHGFDFVKQPKPTPSKKKAEARP